MVNYGAACFATLSANFFLSSDSTSPVSVMTPFSRSCETLTTPRLLLVSALFTASFTSACWAVLQPTSTNTPKKVAVAIAAHISRLVELVLLIVSLLIPAECSAVAMGRWQRQAATFAMSWSSAYHPLLAITDLDQLCGFISDGPIPFLPPSAFP